MAVNIRRLLAEIEFAQRAAPSRAQLLREALLEIERRLGELASSGYPLHLEEGHVAPPAFDWPRRYYHYDEGWRDVMGPGHLAELGPGWYPSLAEAEQAYGEAVQFAGRAGVRRWRALRAEGAPQEPVGVHDSSEARRLAEEWKQRRNGSIG